MSGDIRLNIINNEFIRGSKDVVSIVYSMRHDRLRCYGT